MTLATGQPFDFDVSAYPPLPRLPGLFVTGTDTSVGKTVIAGAIARSLRLSGRWVEVFKPVASGCRRDRGELVSADAEFLAACADSQRMLSEIAPVRYASAVAPNVAARREGRPVDLDAVFNAYCRIEAEVTIVEGIGGLLCPLTDNFWVVHLAKMMALPVLIVAHPLLGTINHTLLTIHAARAAGLNVAGVVINRYRADTTEQIYENEPVSEPDAELAMQTNPEQISLRGQVAVLTLVPEDPATSVEDAAVGPDTQDAIDQVDWEKIMGIGR